MRVCSFFQNGLTFRQKQKKHHKGAFNHGSAVYGIAHKVSVWNLAFASMESRPKLKKYSLSADAIRGRAAIPYNSLCELMPYQALRSWIKKQCRNFFRHCFALPLLLLRNVFRRGSILGELRLRSFAGRTRRLEEFAYTAPTSNPVTKRNSRPQEDSAVSLESN